MKPSPTELAVLKHLWRSGAQSIREIHEAVSPSLNWSRSSTRKTVERMVEKGLVGVRDAHGINVYTATAKKVPTIAAMVRSFAAEVLGLDGAMPVANLVESKLLTPDELQELDALLKREDPS
ncbi:MAG: BlaI/MecI/CopY family transcriptional regulator [Pseudomonadota bacterium]